jgi:hypothetical protein
MHMLQKTKSAFYLVFGASFLLFVFIPRGLAWANGPNSAITKTRLNLRSCPATQDCPVLRTLPRDTPIEVLGSKGDWTQVRVSTGEEGWVNSEYITLNQNSATEPGSTFEWVNLLPPWKLPITLTLLTGAILLLAFLMRMVAPDEFQGPPVPLILVSLALGFTFLLNQFGPLFLKLTAPYFDITALTPLWSINSVCEQISYPTVVLILAILVLAIGAAAPAQGHCRVSFFQGVSAGFLLLPASCIAGAVAVAALWLICKFFSMLFYILGIPVTWIFIHAILPLLRFLAIPLVWLWNSFLRDFLLLIATPFIWIKNVILVPLFSFLARYVFKPIGLLLARIILVMECLFPFAAVGLAILDSARSSLKAKLDSKGLFSQGMALGFGLWDACLLISLNQLGILHSTPPLSLLVLLSLPVIVLLRLLINREAAGASGEGEPFIDKFTTYSEESRIEILATCIILPMFLVMLIRQSGDSGDG